jgi:predicted RNA methylase
VRVNANSTWADLGCGNGVFAYALAEFLIDGSWIYAIDKQQLLESPNIGVGIEFVKGNFEATCYHFKTWMEY